jgi:cysteine-rich repeat protein
LVATADTLIVQNPPLLLPLCGNGRLDTRADYEALYARNGAEPPPWSLQMTYAGLYNYYDPTSRAMPLGWDQLYNLTVLPAAEEGEACDDGNRADFDGCSADCMTLDLWAPACELAVVPSSSSSLEFEALLYDPFRKVMVVSAADGLYSLGLATDTAPALLATRLAPKDFRCGGLVRLPGGILLYGADDGRFSNEMVQAEQFDDTVRAYEENITDVKSKLNRGFHDPRMAKEELHAYLCSRTRVDKRKRQNALDPLVDERIEILKAIAKTDSDKFPFTCCCDFK